MYNEEELASDDCVCLRLSSWRIRNDQLRRRPLQQQRRRRQATAAQQLRPPVRAYRQLALPTCRIRGLPACSIHILNCACVWLSRAGARWKTRCQPTPIIIPQPGISASIAKQTAAAEVGRTINNHHPPPPFHLLVERALAAEIQSKYRVSESESYFATQLLVCTTSVMDSTRHQWWGLLNTDIQKLESKFTTWSTWEKCGFVRPRRREKRWIGNAADNRLQTTDLLTSCCPFSLDMRDRSHVY